MFGPDGKPIPPGMMGGRVVGGPKSVDDVPLLTAHTIDEMYKGVNQIVAQGQPLEVPSVIPLMHFAQIARTLRHFETELAAAKAKLAAVETVLEDSEDGKVERALAELAKGASDEKAPEEQKDNGTRINLHLFGHPGQ